MILNISTTARIAFYSTLIESILGVVVCAVYVLLHFCTIPIKCPGTTSKLNQVAYVFYTTYLKEKDGCDVITTDAEGEGGEHVNEIMSNENNLTMPNIIFFWQMLLLLLYLAWVGSALMLQQVEKKSRSAVPWLFVTFLVILVDFTASAISLTDFRYDEMTTFSCMLDTDWSSTRKSWTTMLLFLYFSRGIFLWILNLWLFLSITAHMIETARLQPPSTTTPQQNKNPATDYWATQPGQTVDLREPDLPQINSFSQQRRHSAQQPSNGNLPQSNGYQPTVDSHHYQAPSKHYQPPVPRMVDTTDITTNTNTTTNTTRVDQDGLRRPQSFAERIRNAENMQGVSRDSQLWSYSNPGVRRELQSRGEKARPLHPDRDVDSAFNFLETYSVKEDTTEHTTTVMEGDNMKSYSRYLNTPQENTLDARQGIPRARIPVSSSDPAGRDGGGASRGPGSRYFVPLKN